jgi:hypothetical protein
MEGIGKQIETLIEGVVEYTSTTLELAKLKAVDRISDAIASLLSRIIAWMALFLFFLFSSLGLAFWLGDLMGKTYLGFFAVAGLYLLLGLLVHLFLGKWIKRLIGNYLIKITLY